MSWASGAGREGFLKEERRWAGRLIKAEGVEGPEGGSCEEVRASSGTQQGPTEVGLSSGLGTGPGDRALTRMNFLGPRGQWRGSCGTRVESGKEQAARDQPPCSLWSGLLGQAGLELPGSRNSPVCPKPSWFPHRQALLCPELAPLGGDRASLAARPDRLWGGVARKPKARIP